MSEFTENRETVPITLPEWLLLQAGQHPAGIALRHKHLGVWQVRSWSQVATQVLSLATALHLRGFAPGATLTLLSRPRPEALLATLAAQWLGGVAALLDPLDAASEQTALLEQLQPDFIFAEGLEELQRVDAARLAPQLVFYADGRTVTGNADGQGRWVAYASLVEQAPNLELPVRGHSQHTAFAFYRRGEGGVLEQQRISHAELLNEGRHLVEVQQLGRHEEALAARAFAAGGQARYLLAPWLIAGFRLNFPESLATRDNDRRELGPTLVAGTRETYGRLHALVLTRLPPVGSWQRHLVEWALASRPGVVRRVLGDWLIRRPLRDVLGFSRTHAALLVGDALPENTKAFFALLGIDIQGWPDPGQWQPRPRASAERVDGWINDGPQLA